ncbi:hypothetical protein [Blastococcus sp. SYSU DS0617]
MLLLVVWIVVVVLSVVVLGALVFGVLGARARLAREVSAFESEVRPLLEQAAGTAERAGRTDDDGAGRR